MKAAAVDRGDPSIYSGPKKLKTMSAEGLAVKSAEPLHVKSAAPLKK